VLTASQPFTSMLVMSNREWFKYTLVWEKTIPGNIFNAKNSPLRSHEDICVFSPGTAANRSSRRMTYNPQEVQPGVRHAANPLRLSSHTAPRPSHKRFHKTHGTNYPKSVLRFSNANHGSFHPTQKPVPLMEYLIKTYSNEGDTVLDNCFGSCTTGIACLNTGRAFVGIEKDAAYFDIGQQRIADALNAPAHLPAHPTAAALPAPGITPPRPGGRKAEPALLPGFAL
jgi:site-specific DNA-methyltransferase (adenine-specific)